MEWLLFAAVAAAAAVYIALPRATTGTGAGEAAAAVAADREELRAERDALLAALRDLDDDAAAGRIAPEDRLRARHALGAPLRTVVERLREQGEP